MEKFCVGLWFQITQIYTDKWTCVVTKKHVKLFEEDQTVFKSGFTDDITD